jgi:hypothetical protein
MTVDNFIDELNLYDMTYQRLHLMLAEKIPSTVDLNDIITSTAYWVCTSGSQIGDEWEKTLQSYAEHALQDPEIQYKADCRETQLLQQYLESAAGPILDIGAGWGRLASLYQGHNLQAVYLEPESLGVRLMHRDGLSSVVRGLGEALPFPSNSFATTVIGWVLHHNSPDSIDASTILSQTARVTNSGGRLISIEPLSDTFDRKKWTVLLENAGFRIKSIIMFHETLTRKGKPQYYSLADCINAV